jgi:thiol-disulfide isomerase/thioredoxin
MRSARRWLIAFLCVAGLGCSRAAERTQHASGSGTAPAAEAGGPPVTRVTAAEFARIVHGVPSAATLVNVWASWCEPCREEFPALLDVARQRQSEGLRLVLVSADFENQLPAVRSFLAEHGVRDTTYIRTGDDMAFIDTLSANWSGALPATFVYDRAGREIAFWEGRADAARFQSAVDKAFQSSSHEGSLP